MNSSGKSSRHRVRKSRKSGARNVKVLATEEEYFVEEILKKRFLKNRPQYLIKWLGYPSNQNTWEPLENLRCLDLVSDFEAKLHSKNELKRNGSENQMETDSDVNKPAPMQDTNGPQNNTESGSCSSQDLNMTTSGLKSLVVSISPKPDQIWSTALPNEFNTEISLPCQSNASVSLGPSSTSISDSDSSDSVKFSGRELYDTSSDSSDAPVRKILTRSNAEKNLNENKLDNFPKTASRNMENDVQVNTRLCRLSSNFIVENGPSTSKKHSQDNTYCSRFNDFSMDEGPSTSKKHNGVNTYRRRISTDSSEDESSAMTTLEMNRLQICGNWPSMDSTHAEVYKEASGTFNYSDDDASSTPERICNKNVFENLSKKDSTNATSNVLYPLSSDSRLTQKKTVENNLANLPNTDSKNLETDVAANTMEDGPSTSKMCNQVNTYCSRLNNDPRLEERPSTSKKQNEVNARSRRESRDSSEEEHTLSLANAMSCSEDKILKTCENYASTSSKKQVRRIYRRLYSDSSENEALLTSDLLLANSNGMPRSREDNFKILGNLGKKKTTNLETFRCPLSSDSSGDEAALNSNHLLPRSNDMPDLQLENKKQDNTRFFPPSSISSGDEAVDMHKLPTALCEISLSKDKEAIASIDTINQKSSSSYASIAKRRHSMVATRAMPCEPKIARRSSLDSSCSNLEKCSTEDSKQTHKIHGKWKTPTTRSKALLQGDVLATEDSTINYLELGKPKRPTNNPTGLQRGLPMEKVLNMFCFEGEWFWFVRWKGCTMIDAVRAEDVSQQYQHLAIEYYQSLPNDIYGKPKPTNSTNKSAKKKKKRR